jgi:hypothetical protein
LEKKKNSKTDEEAACGQKALRSPLPNLNHENQRFLGFPSKKILRLSWR